MLVLYESHDVWLVAYFNLKSSYDYGLSALRTIPVNLGFTKVILITMRTKNKHVGQIDSSIDLDTSSPASRCFTGFFGFD